jgi:MFS family permease
VNRPKLGRNVIAISVVSLLTDISTEMIYPLLPVFLTATLGASASVLGAIEGAAESTSALLKLVSGTISDRMKRRKPLIVAGYMLATIVRPLVAFAQSASQVLAIRLTDRVGKGLRGPPRDALIADSVDASIRGRAFGFNQAMDHAGAFIGPLVAFALLNWAAIELRTVFLLAAIPGALSVVVLIAFVRDRAPTPAPVAPTTQGGPALVAAEMPRSLWAYLAIVFVFTLGSSSDAFLLLRANQLGLPVALTGILWAVHQGVKSLLGTTGGALSDRFGRIPAMIAGWIVYAVVYFGFGFATSQWHVWALFVLYAGFYALTEGAERALVADLVPSARRGAAYGWFNLTIGLGALPASLLFGFLWDRLGAPVAFATGASLALASSVALLVFAAMRRQR